MSIAFYLIVILFLILFPQDTARFATDALIIWGKNIVPVLFPYMVFSRLLSSSIRKTKLPSVPIAAILGILGGSPSGAALIAACSRDISYRMLCTLCTLTGTISPMFILGTIQTWANDAALSRSLLLCHWAGAVFSAGIVYALFPKRYDQACAKNPAPSFSSRHSPISESIDAILQVGGCIICYSVLAGMIGKIPFPNSGFHSIIHAALEISGGAHAIVQSSLRPMQKSVLLCAATGFSGFSILSQNSAFLKQSGLGMQQFVFFAILRACCCALLMIIFESL